MSPPRTRARTRGKAGSTHFGSTDDVLPCLSPIDSQLRSDALQLTSYNSLVREHGPLLSSAGVQRATWIVQRDKSPYSVRRCRPLAVMAMVMVMVMVRLCGLAPLFTEQSAGLSLGLPPPTPLDTRMCQDGVRRPFCAVWSSGPGR